ncbi:MAG TPA: hypothetical protein VH988_20440 [Thermoanaerobaculia bacterium]|jgi:hypothetical protein|nr:hypothetical protein [Thermoanaerobaculia bacterium]
MPSTPGQEILLTASLRANPLYDLVLYDRLSAPERAALAELAKDPGFYGVLRRRDAAARSATSATSFKSVDRDTALLFLTLREPGTLPSYVRAQLGATAPRTVARLVADGVLEVAGGGGYLSGPAALSHLTEAVDRTAGTGRIAELSVAALRYGQALALSDPTLLSWRLYSYNRQPLTPRWQRLLPTPEALARHLGIDAGGAHRKLLDSAWLPSEMAGWMAWWARPRAGGGGESSARRPGGPTWKLYVSPRAEALAESFGAVLAALTAARALQFKVGSDAGGLLRPDKIVAYFPSYERLAAAADSVLARLDGAPAQGVPFTAEIGGGGLLSWGVDPPDAERSVLGGGRESWRVWVAHRLAWALVAGRGDISAGAAGAEGAEGYEPWRFALERVRLEGIDTETWTPSAMLWKEA